MASPQTKNGYTRISNELFDRYIEISRYLSPYENTIWLCILRKTYGYGKKSDWIALSQIEIATGIRQPHVARTKKKLLIKKMILSEDNKLSIQKDYESWDIPKQVLPKQVLPKQVLPKQVTTITQTGNLPLPKQVDTKETITKETITKEIDTVTFENLWKQYPNRCGKKAACKHYQTSVKTDEDRNDIQLALKNYLASPRVINGYIQNGSTWFNNWRDWIDMQTETPEEKQKRYIEETKRRLNL